ncbi:ABC transporter G family member 32 [Vitis vinifera]|uniref:ABC transporter G family member 32 n=1 Tax=Vitis vinifera TaxID=29760 RepID=A0A438KEV9_VITVI|nr:ABC transporter G family member 32 [Vitis vinifera]
MNSFSSLDTVYASPNSGNGDCDDKALRWASLQRIPTYSRARRSLFRNISGEVSEVELCKLDVYERRLVVDRLVRAVTEDPELFLIKLEGDLKIEVRFEHLKVNSFVHVGSRALPTIPNFIFNTTEAFLRQLRIFPGERKKVSILDDISGVIRPSRLTLLLGPPSSGKTTLLLALAGRLGTGLQMSGRITYNGHELREFVPQRTSAYVSQQDWHVAEMTVKETLQFSRRCQGVGFKYDMLLELLRREENAGIKPDEDLDIFIKALALGEQKTSLVTEYIMKILGLDPCADTLVGDEMLKGISGVKRSGFLQVILHSFCEMLVGASTVLFMDEISTGLDSSTTHQIIKYLRHSTQALNGTTVISLLQPDPETYELFDDIILLAEGQIVYQGPSKAALEFFELMGFQCPDRKMWLIFCKKSFQKKIKNSIGPFLIAIINIHPAALSTFTYGVKRAELLKMSFSWQMLLMKRNSFIYIFKFTQLLFVVVIMVTVFFRTTMHHNTLDDGGVYLGALYFAIVMILFNGFTEVPMLVAKLPVLYKHRDLRFYPCWVYTIPSWFLSIPSSILESCIWVAVTYYVVGFDPQITRCLKQALLYFSLHQMSISLFRIMASLDEI